MSWKTNVKPTKANMRRRLQAALEAMEAALIMSDERRQDPENLFDCLLTAKAAIRQAQRELD